MAAVAAVIVARELHLLSGWGAVLFAVVLFILMPVSANLSRRVMIVGALVIGWVPIAWWPGLWGFGDRVTWLLALAVGALVFWLFAGPSRALRCRALVPRVRGSDAITIAAGAGATWLLWPLMVAASDARALTLLMKSGWDHVAHYFMASHLTAAGSLQAATGTSSDGSEFVQGHYPKHFHILVSATSELFSGPNSTVSIQEYGRATGLVMVVVVFVLAAALAQLPGFVNRPLLAWPAITLVIAAFLLGPGTVALSAGFPNFVIACAFPVVAACLAVGSARMTQPVTLFAIGGMLVATAHSWLLMAPLTAVAALVILVPHHRARWRGTPAERILSALALTATFAASLFAVLIAASTLSEETLTSGGVEKFPAGFTLMILLSVLAAAGFSLSRMRRIATTRLRAASAAAIVLALAAMLVAVGGRQLLLSGELTYYFAKLASSAGLVGFGVLAVVVSSLPLHTRVRRARRRAALSVAASVFATLAALQAFGYVGPSFGKAITEKAPGMQYRSDALVLTSGESPEALRLLAAAELAEEQPFGSTVYLAVLYGDPLMRLANQWHLSLNGRWSEDAEQLGMLIDTEEMAIAAADEKLGPVVEEILTAEPEISIIVAPEVRDAIVAELPGSLHKRIISWPGS
ncbi:hypothetical protein DCE94_06245 [Agromyces badenianii]|nr:hypothetical protein DCE94_06245 [Agromyces badenianii]